MTEMGVAATTERAVEASSSRSTGGRVIEGTLATGGRVVEDRWTTVRDVEALAAFDVDAPMIVPLVLFESSREALATRPQVGVLLAGDDDPARLASDLDRVALIAIDFPKFTDGRGYSIARLLRERHGYRGALRATGDVLRDQLFYLARCGFDSFAMRHPERVDDALAAFHDFSDGYQTSVEQPLPWFKRRAAALVGEAR